MSRGRILFFPWSAGGGAGYTGRSLVVAARLAGSYDCAFGPDAVEAMVREAGFELVDEPGYERPAPPRVVPPYLPFANVERVYAVTARYYRPETVRAHVERDCRIVERYRPDVVVTDMQPTAAVAARTLGLPLVSLADTDFLSLSPVAWMPWLTADPEAVLPYPSCLPAFNAVLAERGLGPVVSPAELLWGDVTIVPSAPELEPPPPPPDGREPIVYVGPLFWDPPSAPFEPPPSPPGAPAARVYVTIGSGGMVTEAAIQAVLDGLADERFELFLSRGLASADGLRLPPNARVGGFTGLSKPIAWADVVLSHGGYSTVIAAFAHGRPQVVVPFMSEQEANGRQMVERTGCGLLVRTTTVDEETAKVRYVNRHSGPSSDPIPPPHDVRQTVEAVLGDPRFARNAAEMAGRLERARAAADFERLFARARG